MHRDFRPLLQKYPENLGNYMDDWWIATGNNEAERTLHRQITHEFLDTMEEKTYFLKPKKCQFEQESMDLLGWLVGHRQVKIDPTKVQGISEWPQDLKNIKEVRSTLGVLGYQRPFIKGFAVIAKPLHDLTKKGTVFHWTDKCRQALNKLIEIVTTGPVLWHPDPEQPFELESRRIQLRSRKHTISNETMKGKTSSCLSFLCLTQGRMKLSNRGKGVPRHHRSLEEGSTLGHGVTHQLIIFSDHDNSDSTENPRS